MGVLEGQVALVTGASGGIGREICRLFAAEGADLVIQYLHGEESAGEAADSVRAVGRHVELVQSDMAKVAEARVLVGRAARRFRRLDVLVNAAGTWPRRPALDMTEADWDQVLDTNLKGMFFCCQAAGRVMKAAGHGRIVNISSLAVRGAAKGAHYSASKAGILGLTRALALEWGPEVLVNAVAPGLVDTRMPREAMTEDEIAGRVEAIPLRRLGLPEDIARAVLFLASDLSSWITGQVIHVNGGDYMP